MDLDTFPAALRYAWPQGLQGLVMLQELPRAEAGWTTAEKEGLTVIGYRDELAWRGVGIGYKSAEWLVMRRKAAGRALWLRMRRKQDGMECWVGSVHLSQGVSCNDHTREMEEALQLLPATTLPCVLGCDGNASLKWLTGPHGEALSYGADLKADNLLGTLGEHGFGVVAPGEEQLHTPTSRPRRDGVSGHQIDFIAVKHVHAEVAHIHVDSYKALDGDHDFVTSCLATGCRRQVRERVDTRPRKVVGVVPTQTYVNQEVFKELAQQYTSPHQSSGYRDPADVKTLFHMARHSRRKEDWKTALRARKRARSRWSQARLQEAVDGDWVQLKRLHGDRRKGWETSFACHMAEAQKEPHQAIHDHLEGIFGEGEDVSHLVEEEIPDSPEITEEEILVGVGKAKAGKAVGVDLTSKELLAAMVQDPVTVQAIRAWFTEILRSGEVPEDWGKAVMVILPKVQAPQTVRDVRPIAMGSAVGKLFSRILLNRAMGIMKHETAIQCAGTGRQTTDYLYAIAKSFDLEREWKAGTVWAKIDISKAFDTLNRHKFLTRLKERMGCTQEFRCWTRMLQRNEALLMTPWHTTKFSMRSGVKQGAVESPTFFAKVVEWIFSDAQERCQWTRDPSSFPNLGLPGVCYMDDGVLWHAGSARVERRLAELTEELLQWGLRVNHGKCRVYFSPHARVQEVKVDGQTIPRVDSMEVMGVNFWVGASPSDLIAGPLGMARSKFWACKHLLVNATSLRKRMILFDKLVTSSALWCCSAIVPDRMALLLVNRHLLRLVTWMLRSKRGSQETWLDHHLRKLRTARSVLHSTVKERWSTKWLRRMWGYMGHVARGTHKESAPASSVMSDYRDRIWWQQQQQQSTGIRHKGRFFPKLANWERDLSAICKGDWKAKALDRPGWKSLEQAWVNAMDVEWASGGQNALME